MRYVYGCTETPTHHQEEAEHSMEMCDRAVGWCPVCGAPLARIPQLIRFYINPTDVLLDWMDDNYTAARERAGRRQ